MTTARTQEELDAYARDLCGRSKCKVKHVVMFVCAKHTDAPTLVTYEQGSGVLQISCVICEGLVAELEIASRERALVA